MCTVNCKLNEPKEGKKKRKTERISFVNVTELRTPVNQQKILSFRPVIKALFDPLVAH